MGFVRRQVSIPPEMDEWVRKGHRSPSKILQYRIREMMNEEKRKNEILDKLENQEGKG